MIEVKCSIEQIVIGELTLEPGKTLLSRNNFLSLYKAKSSEYLFAYGLGSSDFVKCPKCCGHLELPIGVQYEAVANKAQSTKGITRKEARANAVRIAEQLSSSGNSHTQTQIGRHIENTTKDGDAIAIILGTTEIEVKAGDE